MSDPVPQSRSRIRDIRASAERALKGAVRALFEEIDLDALRSEVERLRRAEPDFSEKRHAERLIRRAGLRCAAAGALTGLPSGVLAAATLGADVAYLVYQQFRLILGIATVYGHEPSDRERFQEALTCLAFGSGVGLGKSGLTVALEAATVESVLIAEKVGEKLLRDRMTRAIPVVGVVTGGVLNWVAVYATGRFAIRYYESKRSGSVTPAEGSLPAGDGNVEPGAGLPLTPLETGIHIAVTDVAHPE